MRRSSIVALCLDVRARSLALRSVPSAEDHGAASGQPVTVLDDARGPAVLTVRRTADDDVQDRQVYLSVDGEDWVTLRYGNEVSRELAPGPHTLKANNTLVWKTVPFMLGPYEQLYFEAINRTGWGTLPMTVLFGIGPLYVTVRRM